MNRPHQRTRSRVAKPLLILVSALLFAHVCVLIFDPRPAFASNLIQFIFPLFAVGVSLQQRAGTLDPIRRRCWLLLALAFVIWAGGQAVFLYSLRSPIYKVAGVRSDDVLWLLFGLPLLLAINTTDGEGDRVARLDTIQTSVFFAVLYLLVFQSRNGMSLSKAYLIQNLALVFCCLLRIPVCRYARERRFFTRLTIYLVFYSACESVGDYLYSRGFQAGSLVDLVWTVPVFSLISLILVDAMRFEEHAEGDLRVLRVVRRMQGLSVVSLASLAMLLSTVVMVHHLILGGTFTLCSFALLAFRVSAREKAWIETHDRLEELTFTDALTGLGNRVQLRNALKECLLEMPGDRLTFLLFVDMDRFKTVNDTFGHAVGDELLVAVAARLRSACTSGSVVCRVGGDEFVVLTHIRSENSIESSADLLLTEMRRPFRIGAHTIASSASVGVVPVSNQSNTGDLLRFADHAMYQAKQVGKDCVRVFDLALESHLSKRSKLEADLRRAVEAEEIDIAFQPIVSVKSAKTIGFEALARWSHPEWGTIPPSEFIPLAEESGLIGILGTQLIKRACAHMARWNLEWKSSFSLSVNVSPRQLAESSFIKKILVILTETGFSAELLSLEITESALLTHETLAKQLLAEARSHGIHVSLDDFGTGYSSLAFLLNLPVDEIKVDRSFVTDMVTDPKRMEVVRTVVHLGQSLGKRVVAEGVETEEELNELSAMGCGSAQGYFFSRPMSAKQMQWKMSDMVGVGDLAAGDESHLKEDGSRDLDQLVLHHQALIV